MSKVKDTQEQQKVEISVHNFGPITEAKIDLRPLTVFVGPSNTGKTYFATLVFALCGTFYELSGSGLLSLFDPGQVRNILSKILNGLTLPLDETMDILDKLNMPGRPFKVSDLTKEVHPILGAIDKDVALLSEKLQNELENCFVLNSISELMRLAEGSSNDTSVLLRIGQGDQKYWNIRYKIPESEVIFENSTSSENSASKNLILLPEGWSANTTFRARKDSRFIINSIKQPRRKNRYFLPAARSGIMQSHRIIASSLVKRSTLVGLEQFPEVPTLSGVIAEFLQQIILYDEDRNSDRQMELFPNQEKSENEVRKLANALESEILAGQVRVKPSSGGYPDFRYSPHGLQEELRLSQASSMIAELTPLVLFLRGLVQCGDTLIIEEPEAHLHPGAQADIAVILARLVRAGVKVIITTHSDWLLQEIGNLIIEGLLENENSEESSWLLPEEVGVWHFQKDKPVEEIHFKHREGISPEDYQDVAEGLYNRSVNLQQKYEKQKDRSGCESE